MAQIKEIDIEGGVLGVSFFERETGEHAKIEYYRGKGISASVPENVDGADVSAIGKKAFLGAKTLTKISVPDTVEEIGDYAFASCSALVSVRLPYRDMTLGGSLFRDCVNLKNIYFDNKAGVNEDIPYLLALAVSKMDAQYLLDIKKAGSDGWTEHLDSLISRLLDRDDTEGFSKMLLCGEEDYVGDDSNLDTYVLLRRREKAEIILERLMHPYGLSDRSRILFTGYLKENITGIVWPLILDRAGDELEYAELLIAAGCIDSGNISGLIEGMGDRNTAVKSYLIKHKSEQSGGSSFFDDLDF